MELESAIKDIFLHCLNDKEILEKIQSTLNCTDSNTVSKGNDEIQGRGKSLLIENNDIILLMKKMDDMISKQESIEEYIKGKNQVSVISEEDILNKEKEIQEKYYLEMQKEKEKFKEEKEKLQEEIGNLNNSKEEIQKEKSILEVNSQKIQKEKDELKSKINTLESDCQKLEKQMDKFSVFKESLEVWECIQSMSAETKEYIDELCGSLDILAVLSLGRDDGKIEQLWLYLKDMAVKNDSAGEIYKLNRFFEFCIKVANTTKSENERYVVSEIETKSEFDMDLCIRTSDSKQIGRITNILVKNIYIGKSIKFKAVVKVECAPS